MQSCRVLARALSTSVRRPATTRLTYKEPGSRGVVPNAPGYKKVMELQKLMCADDGLLVWQKRGVRDMGMYWASMTLMLGGIGAAFYQLFVMSFPKKK